jgi:hypothetical protein
MKKIILVTIFLMGSLFAFAQQNWQEVVYLKDGSILRGTIIEQVPNKSLKIQLDDGSVFVHEMDEVEKITKEQPVTNSYNPPQEQEQKTEIRRNGYEGSVSFGYGFGVGTYQTDVL